MLLANLYMKISSPEKTKNTFRFLRVIPSVNPAIGGPIEGIKQLHLAMAQFNFDMEVVCCDSPGSPWLETCDLPRVHALGPSYGSYAYSPRLLPWLRANIHRFDAVIINGIWQYHSYAVRKSLLGVKIPYYVFTHGMLDPWFKKAYPLKHIKKWLYWPWAEYKVLRDAKAVIFTSEEERLLARKSFWLYEANEVVASYGTAGPPSNGDDLAQLFISKHPELKGKRIILFLSRIHEKKGCDLLIHAFSQVAGQDRTLHLVIAGPDKVGLTAQLKSLANLLGIADRISWVGMLEGGNKWGAFYACEVFCLPSHQENFGIVVAEALSCGKPVLISNKVNIWREISENKAGFIGADNIVGTLSCIKQWLALDKSEYLKMSERAKYCFQSCFEIMSAAKNFKEILLDNHN